MGFDTTKWGFLFAVGCALWSKLLPACWDLTQSPNRPPGVFRGVPNDVRHRLPCSAEAPLSPRPPLRFPGPLPPPFPTPLSVSRPRVCLHICPATGTVTAELPSLGPCHRRPTSAPSGWGDDCPHCVARRRARAGQRRSLAHRLVTRSGCVGLGQVGNWMLWGWGLAQRFRCETFGPQMAPQK